MRHSAGRELDDGEIQESGRGRGPVGVEVERTLSRSRKVRGTDSRNLGSSMCKKARAGLVSGCCLGSGTGESTLEIGPKAQFAG